MHDISAEVIGHHQVQRKMKATKDCHINEIERVLDYYTNMQEFSEYSKVQSNTNKRVVFLILRPQNKCPKSFSYCSSSLRRINPWIPKVRIQGDSTKVGSKMTPQEKSIFPRKINNSRKKISI